MWSGRTESYRSGHNGAVSKTVGRQRHVGSNPTLSAIRKHGLVPVFSYGGEATRGFGPTRGSREAEPEATAERSHALTTRSGFAPLLAWRERDSNPWVHAKRSRRRQLSDPTLLPHGQNIIHPTHRSADPCMGCFFRCSMLLFQYPRLLWQYTGGSRLPSFRSGSPPRSRPCLRYARKVFPG